MASLLFGQSKMTRLSKTERLNQAADKASEAYKAAPVGKKLRRMWRAIDARTEALKAEMRKQK